VTWGQDWSCSMHSLAAAVKPMKQTFPKLGPVRVPHARDREWRDFTALGGLVESASRLEVADARVDFRALQPLFGDPDPLGSISQPANTTSSVHSIEQTAGFRSSSSTGRRRTRSHSRTVPMLATEGNL